MLTRRNWIHIILIPLLAYFLILKSVGFYYGEWIGFSVGILIQIAISKAILARLEKELFAKNRILNTSMKSKNFKFLKNHFLSNYKLKVHQITDDQVNDMLDSSDPDRVDALLDHVELKERFGAKLQRWLLKR